MSTDVSKCAQVVFELMCKAAELIIQSKVQLGGKTGARVPNSKVCACVCVCLPTVRVYGSSRLLLRASKALCRCVCGRTVSSGRMEDGVKPQATGDRLFN